MTHKKRNKTQRSHPIDQQHSLKGMQTTRQATPTVTNKDQPVQLSHQTNAHAAFSPRTTLSQGRGH